MCCIHMATYEKKDASEIKELLSWSVHRLRDAAPKSELADTERQIGIPRRRPGDLSGWLNRSPQPKAFVSWVLSCSAQHN
jgi:hypothetical protein